MMKGVKRLYKLFVQDKRKENREKQFENIVRFVKNLNVGFYNFAFGNDTPPTSSAERELVIKEAGLAEFHTHRDKIKLNRNTIVLLKLIDPDGNVTLVTFYVTAQSSKPITPDQVEKKLLVIAKYQGYVQRQYNFTIKNMITFLVLNNAKLTPGAEKELRKRNVIPVNDVDEALAYLKHIYEERTRKYASNLKFVGQSAYKVLRHFMYVLKTLKSEFIEYLLKLLDTSRDVSKEYVRELYLLFT